MVLIARAARDPVRVPPPRGRHRRPVRDRHALRDADAHGRPGHDLQVRRQERRAKRAGKTATFMPKPIFGDNGSGMHTHQSLWKDGTTLMADESGLRWALRQLARDYVGGLLDARAGAARVLRADDELVPPARAGLRGAGQPRLLAAQPLGVHPHPDVLRLAEGEADRVPLPRPDREPVPHLLGDADGGPRRDPERSSTRARRPTSTSSRSARAEIAAGARARSRRRSTRSRPTTSSCSQATSSARS